MFELHTKRLKLIPLNLEQLKIYKEDHQKLEKELGLGLTESEKFDELTESELDGAWLYWLSRVEKHPYDYFWFTRWEIIEKEKNIIIGSCGFKGSPDEKGEVEVGYMIKPSHQGKGYMSEALKELVHYAFHHYKVKAVIAETSKDHFQSQKVLLNNGFEKREEKDGIFVWHLPKEKFIF